MRWLVELNLSATPSLPFKKLLFTHFLRGHIYLEKDKILLFIGENYMAGSAVSKVTPVHLPISASCRATMHRSLHVSRAIMQWRHHPFIFSKHACTHTCSMSARLATDAACMHARSLISPCSSCLNRFQYFHAAVLTWPTPPLQRYHALVTRPDSSSFRSPCSIAYMVAPSSSAPRQSSANQTAPSQSS